MTKSTVRTLAVFGVRESAGGVLTSSRSRKRDEAGSCVFYECAHPVLEAPP